VSFSNIDVYPPSQALSKQCAEAEAARQAQLIATKALLKKVSETDAALAAQAQQLEALEERCGLAEASRDALMEEVEGLRRTAEDEIEAIKRQHKEDIAALTGKMVRVGDGTKFIDFPHNIEIPTFKNIFDSYCCRLINAPRQPSFWTG